MSISVTIKKAITAELRPLGFIRKGSTWRLRKKDVIAVLNLQKDDSDYTYYLNVGFWLRQFEEMKDTRPELCHVQTRANRLHPERSAYINNLFADFESCDDANDRVADIRRCLHESIAPILVECTTIPKLIQLVAHNRYLLVRRDACNALGRQEELPDD